MARNPVPPVAAIEPVSCARIAQRSLAYVSNLEEWRMYSQLLAQERRLNAQPIAKNALDDDGVPPCR